MSTRDPTAREDYGAREADVDDAIAYARRHAEDDRIRRQVEQRRRTAAENYWRENIERVKGASRGNYCRRKYGQQAQEMNAVPIFKDEECVGRPHPTFRDHPDIQGLRVEDVCTLCVRDQARAIRNEEGEWIASEYTRKTGINRGTGAGAEEEEYALLRTPPARTIRQIPQIHNRPRMAVPLPAPALAAPAPAPARSDRDIRREQFVAQRDARRNAARRQYSGLPSPRNSLHRKPRSAHQFGMKLFANKSAAPKSVFTNKKRSSKKTKKTKAKRRSK